jgi:hypothetical protein
MGISRKLADGTPFFEGVYKCVLFAFLFSLNLTPALNIFRVHSERRVKLRFGVLFHNSTP